MALSKNDSRAAAICSGSIGEEYLLLGIENKAAQFLGQAVAEFNKLKQTDQLPKLYCLLGTVQMKKGKATKKYELAIHCLEQGIRYSTLYPNKEREFTGAQADLGIIYGELGKYDEARPHLEIALSELNGPNLRDEDYWRFISTLVGAIRIDLVTEQEKDLKRHVANLVRINRLVPANQYNTGALNNLARQALLNKQFKSAIDIAQCVLDFENLSANQQNAKATSIKVIQAARLQKDHID